VNLTTDLPKYQTIVAFEQCFNLWEELLLPIRFKATSNKEEAAILINFVNNDNAPYKFDEGVLAYAFAPYGGELQGTMWFNEALTWADMHKDGSIDLFKVAVHEVGHVLNIGHTTDKEYPNDIMQPIYNPYVPVIFTKDTKDAIQALYGKIIASLSPEKKDKGVLGQIFTEVNDLLGLRRTSLNILAEHLGIENAGKKERNMLCHSILFELQKQNK
jgi:hypothetical protein